MDRMQEAEAFLSILSDTLCRSELRSTVASAKGEMGLLLYLCFRHDGAHAWELKNKLGVGSGRIANALKSLESKGFITRTTAPNDRRAILVHLTPSGKAYAETQYQALLSQTSKLFDYLGEEDTANLLRILKRIQALPAASGAKAADDAQQPDTPSP